LNLLARFFLDKFHLKREFLYKQGTGIFTVAAILAANRACCIAGCLMKFGVRPVCPITEERGSYTSECQPQLAWIMQLGHP